MEWEVVLRGPEHILRELVPAFKGKTDAIVESKDGFALRSIRLLWTDLYRLFEVIVEGAGGAGAVVAAGWANQAQLRKFKHSANSVKAAGDQARHGVETTDPPADPMTISEARSLVDILLARWLGKGAV